LLIINTINSNLCSYSGCGLGRECVYDNSWICTPDKPDIPCQCQQGKCVCFRHLLGHSSLCWLSCLGPLLLLLKRFLYYLAFHVSWLWMTLLILFLKRVVRIYLRFSLL